MKRVLAGVHAVTEAVRAHPRELAQVYVAEGRADKPIADLLRLCELARVDVEPVVRDKLDALAPGLQHQGVVAIAGELSYLDLDGLVTRACAASPHPLLVVLDQLQDPRNLGAILRSAHAFGAAGVILTRDRSAAVTPAAVRTSAGASELVRVARVGNLAQALDDLRGRGFQLVGAASGEGLPAISTLDFTPPTVLVLGSEGRGLRRLTAERCDRLFTIPLCHGFDSLNVSVAAAICLFTAAEQRRRGDQPT